MSAAREAFERFESALELERYERDVEALHARFQPLAMHYKDMCTAVEAHRKPDRSALLRMAGNIAGGLVANPALLDNANGAKQYAHAAVMLARAIMAEVDKAETKEQVR